VSDTALFRRLAKAFALGDTEQAKRLDAEIPDGEREAYNVYVTAFLFGAVGHRFEDDHSLDAIKKFAAEMSDEYRNAPVPVRVLAVEGLIRAVFGEDNLLDEISPEDQLRLPIPIIRKIVAQSPHMRERLDDYLTDAATLATQWTS
jgi:hypothetical protein